MTKSKIQNYLLEPATFKLDGGAMYGIIPKPLWNKRHPSDELNRIDLALRLWLIKTDSRLILIDTGIGDYHGEKFNKRFDVKSDQSPLAQAISHAGFSLEDVTDLVISHLHFDHVGGICKENSAGKMEPVLPQARCHVHRSHYEYSLSPTDRDQGSFHSETFDPIIRYYKDAQLLHFYDGEEGDLFDLAAGKKLSFKCSHGHTPWLMHPYTDRFIYLSDLVPTSHHLSIPWVMGYDISPGITTENKKEFFNFINEKKLSIIYEHDPKFWGSQHCGQIHFESKDLLSYSID